MAWSGSTNACGNETTPKKGADNSTGRGARPSQMPRYGRGAWPDGTSAAGCRLEARDFARGPSKPGHATDGRLLGHGKAQRLFAAPAAVGSCFSKDAEANHAAGRGACEAATAAQLAGARDSGCRRLRLESVGGPTRNGIRTGEEERSARPRECPQPSSGRCRVIRRLRLSSSSEAAIRHLRSDSWVRSRGLEGRSMLRRAPFARTHTTPSEGARCASTCSTGACDRGGAWIRGNPLPETRAAGRRRSSPWRGPSQSVQCLTHAGDSYVESP